MNAELKQAVERLEFDCSKEHYVSYRQSDDVRALLKAVREMGEDKARLELLAERYEQLNDSPRVYGLVFHDKLPDLRQAIDAAMSNTKE